MQCPCAAYLPAVGAGHDSCIAKAGSSSSSSRQQHAITVGGLKFVTDGLVCTCVDILPVCMQRDCPWARLMHSYMAVTVQSALHAMNMTEL
jgi:hypothetical protein